MGLGAAELAAAKAEQDAIFATADERDALIAELDGLAVEPSTAKTTRTMPSALQAPAQAAR